MRSCGHPHGRNHGEVVGKRNPPKQEKSNANYRCSSSTKRKGGGEVGGKQKQSAAY